MNTPDWIPENVRKNSGAAWFISIALAMTATAVGTYYVMNATTFAGMRERNDGLLQQNQHLAQELQAVQERHDKVVAGRDDGVAKKVSEYRDSLSSLSTLYADKLKENQDLINALNVISSGERQRAAQLKESQLSTLNGQLKSNSNRIAEPHRILYETSATAAYYARDCANNDGGSFSNLCEQAAKYAAQTASLREQIGSLEKNADILNAQILALDVSGSERMTRQTQ